MDQTYAGDEILSDTDVIEVHVSELGQIFNSMDPSPFHDKDLDVERRSSSSVGRGSCRGTSRWLSAFTSTGRP